MDSQRFDRLSRHVGKQTSRRGAIKAAAGGTLAVLGGLLAGGPFGPPGVTDLPPFAPSSGVCRYRNGCANEGQSCQRNDDCCNGENLFCGNNHCRRR